MKQTSQMERSSKEIPKPSRDWAVRESYTFWQLISKIRPSRLLTACWSLMNNIFQKPDPKTFGTALNLYFKIVLMFSLMQLLEIDISGLVRNVYYIVKVKMHFWVVSRSSAVLQTQQLSLNQNVPVWLRISNGSLLSRNFERVNDTQVCMLNCPACPWLHFAALIAFLWTYSRSCFKCPLSLFCL